MLPATSRFENRNYIVEHGTVWLGSFDLVWFGGLPRKTRVIFIVVGCTLMLYLCFLFFDRKVPLCWLIKVTSSLGKIVWNLTWWEKGNHSRLEWNYFALGKKFRYRWCRTVCFCFCLVWKPHQQHYPVTNFVFALLMRKCRTCLRLESSRQLSYSIEKKSKETVATQMLLRIRLEFKFSFLITFLFLHQLRKWSNVLRRYFPSNQQKCSQELESIKVTSLYH